MVVAVCMGKGMKRIVFVHPEFIAGNENGSRLGIRIERSKICGGGAKSPLWRKIIANVLNIKIDRIESEEGPGYGGSSFPSHLSLPYSIQGRTAVTGNITISKMTMRRCFKWRRRKSISVLSSKRNFRKAAIGLTNWAARFYNKNNVREAYPANFYFYSSGCCPSCALHWHGDKQRLFRLGHNGD